MIKCKWCYRYLYRCHWCVFDTLIFIGFVSTWTWWLAGLWTPSWWLPGWTQVSHRHRRHSLDMTRRRNLQRTLCQLSNLKCKSSIAPQKMMFPVVFYPFNCFVRCIENIQSPRVVCLALVSTQWFNQCWVKKHISTKVWRVLAASRVSGSFRMVKDPFRVQTCSKQVQWFWLPLYVMVLLNTYKVGWFMCIELAHVTVSSAKLNETKIRWEEFNVLSK